MPPWREPRPAEQVATALARIPFLPISANERQDDRPPMAPAPDDSQYELPIRMDDAGDYSQFELPAVEPGRFSADDDDPANDDDRPSVEIADTKS